MHCLSRWLIHMSCLKDEIVKNPGSYFCISNNIKYKGVVFSFDKNKDNMLKIIYEIAVCAQEM